MTPQSEVGAAPTARASEAGDGVRGPATSASGSTSEERLACTLADLARVSSLRAGLQERLEDVDARLQESYVARWSA